MAYACQILADSVSEAGIRSHPAEYAAWCNAKYRCNNPKASAYPGYGARGIRFCSIWQGPGGFSRFLTDVGPKPSVEHQLDRMDNDGDYKPGNCRWSTVKEQAVNRRSTRWIEFKGQFRSVADWAHSLGITKQSLSWRIDKWGLERALTTPKMSQYDHTPDQETWSDYGV